MSLEGIVYVYRVLLFVVIPGEHLIPDHEGLMSALLYDLAIGCSGTTEIARVRFLTCLTIILQQHQRLAGHFFVIMMNDQ